MCAANLKKVRVDRNQLVLYCWGGGGGDLQVSTGGQGHIPQVYDPGGFHHVGFSLAS